MNNLEYHIKNIILNNDYMPIDQFLSIVIPFYYINQDSLGEQGDFITAPEISQLFGEMISLYVADFWLKNLLNTKITLVELGPGSGYLMEDFLRATKHIKIFADHIEQIVMYEISPKLQNIQKKNLKNYLPKCHWINSFQELEDYTIRHCCIFIANEFFDTLPVRQFQFINKSWYEVCIILDDQQKLVTKPLIKMDNPISNTKPTLVTENFILEYSIYTKNYLELISKSIHTNSGLALLIDYGYVNYPNSNTIQAIKNHQKINFLESIGEADITYLVNFASMQKQLMHANLQTILFTQKNFLEFCGIRKRAAQLIEQYGADQNKIDYQLEKLLSANHMGELFKFLITCK